MKRFYILLIILISLTSSVNSQAQQRQQAITGDIKNDLNNLLPNSSITIDVMDGVEQNKRQEELTKKLQEGIQNNYEWFLDFVKTVPNGQPMPYNAKLGLTEDEYKELQGYMNNIELVSSGKYAVIIKNKNNIIEFEANDEKLKLLEYVKIDLIKNVVTIGEYELVFSDTVNVTNDKNGLNSKWKGYTWKLKEPKDLDLNALKDLQTLKVKEYKFTIGQLEKNGKRFMLIKGQEIINGERQVDFELPLIF